MKIIGLVLVCSAILTAAACARREGSELVKPGAIGIYDSRAIAVAFAGSAAHEAKIREMREGMKKAEAKLEPALVPLRDQVLFMKHNLNARAIAGLGDELISVQANVDLLVRDMDAAISQADRFIASLREE